MSKDRPVIVDGTVIGVLAVGKGSVVDELSSDGAILTVLERVTVLGSGSPVPVAEFCLVRNLRPRLLCLTVNLVIDDIVSGSSIFPLSNAVGVTRYPFYYDSISKT